ncbi:MAG: hypothetical protein AMXMBFR47_19410 [Planctomycetota bacterium]
MALSPDAVEWIDRAEADVRAVRKLDLPEDRLVIAFHTQRAVEKYLKGVLVNAGSAFPKIHDLLALIALCAKLDVEFDTVRAAAATLQPFAVDVRYPGPAPSEAVVRGAVATMEQIRTLCRRKLGLPSV